MSTELKVVDESLRLDQNYKDFLAAAKARLKAAQLRASLASNSVLIQYYWEQGCDIIEKQKAYKWGDKFLEQFSLDMRNEFPGMEGFSITTLKRMRLFAREYPDFKIGAQAVHQLLWGHIV
jgi:predicted nuclease of restriction endonuclease-like (RecB) superfamily